MTNELTAKTQVSFGDSGVKLTTLDDAFRFADAIFKSGLAPAAYKKPETVLIVMQTGMELGYSPMQAIRNMWAGPDGRPNEYVEASWARALQSGLVEDWSEEVTPEQATFRVKRRGIPTIVTSTYTLDQAKRAGLYRSGGNWEKHTERMLKARAKGFAIKDAFADVLKGISVAETIDSFYGPEKQEAKPIAAPSKPDPLFELLDVPETPSSPRPAPIDVQTAVVEDVPDVDPTPPTAETVSAIAARNDETRVSCMEKQEQPRLVGADGDVLAADAKGFSAWGTSWVAMFQDIGKSPSALLPSFERAASEASLAMDGNSAALKRIEDLHKWADGLAKQEKATQTEML